MIDVHDQLHWGWHLIMIEDVRLPKLLFNGKWQYGTTHKPKKCFKDMVSQSQGAQHIYIYIYIYILESGSR